MLLRNKSCTETCTILVILASMKLDLSAIEAINSANDGDNKIKQDF